MYQLYNVWEFCFCSYMNDENFLLVIMMIPIWKISSLIFRVCSGPESGN